MNTYDWTYQGKPFNPDNAGVNVGFVYLITNLTNGKRYIGMKHFEKSANTRVFTKKGLAEMERLGIKKSSLKTVKDKKPFTRRSLGKTDSGWEDYWGSSGDKDAMGTLKSDIEKFGKEAFTREIIELVRFKAELRYLEAKHIIMADAVRRPDYYNGNVRITALVNNITTATSRSELYAKCREENPLFAATHGPQAILKDEAKEMAETYSRQNMSREEYAEWLMTS